MRSVLACLVLTLLSGPALADGWTKLSGISAYRIRTDGSILVKGAWNFTPTCGTNTNWVVIDAANPLRDLLYDAVRTTFRVSSIKFWWIDSCVEMNPGGDLLQLVTMIETG